MGHDITVVCRRPYVTATPPPTAYKGVKLLTIDTPRRKSFEAIVHTWRAVLAARRLKPDIIHIHAVGPALLVPLARLLGMKVVTTNHGPDYERHKWGRAARFMLRAGERMGARWSNAVIVISTTIRDILATKYGRTDTSLIFNGVNMPDKTSATTYVHSLGLTPGRYVVAVGRFVEEKGFHDLIEAFSKAGLPEGYRLVIAGDADHPDAYSSRLKALAADRGVVLTGFIRGEKMRQLMSHAALFAMPSYHEGLPIALLEAMSYGLDVAVSDIPACRLDQLTGADHFPVGDTDALASLLHRKLMNAPAARSYDLSPYNWDTIARQTEELYKQTIHPSATE